MKGPSAWRLRGVLAAVLTLSCAERQVDGDETEYRMRCSWIAVFIEEGGSTFRLVDSSTGLANTKVCTCSGDEEWLDPDYRDDMNEMAYEACLAFVAAEGYEAEASSCEADYLDGLWAKSYGVGELFSEPPALCGSSLAGCSVR